MYKFENKLINRGCYNAISVISKRLMSKIEASKGELTSWEQ